MKGGFIKKTIIFLAIFLLLAWYYFRPPKPMPRIELVAQKNENYTRLLEELLVENYAIVFETKLRDYDENYLSWIETIEDITEAEFFSLMDNLNYHNILLKSLDVSPRPPKIAVSPPNKYVSSPRPWLYVGEPPGFALFYDDGIYGIAETGQRDWWGGFSFPLVQDRATIEGIEVTLKDTYAEEFPAYWKVKLSWNNRWGWTMEESVSVTESSPPGGTYVLGGPEYKWGREWTTDEIKYYLWIELRPDIRKTKLMYLDYATVSVYYLENWERVAEIVENIIIHKKMVENLLRERFPQFVPRFWVAIENWKGIVEAPANWAIIENWEAFIEAPADWQTIETWRGMLKTPNPPVVLEVVKPLEVPRRKIGFAYLVISFSAASVALLIILHKLVAFT